jgi:thiol-disulfide isomerase/thioredoxin
MKFTTFLLFAVAASAIELTPDNYEAETAGKVVFLKFFAPWCGHCKKMKPDWDKLMTKFAGSTDVLVADVDCTTGGKPLCDANGVGGFPTLKHGSPDALEAYEAGRDYATLEKFAGDMKPKCGPSNLDLCNAEEKADLQKLFDLSTEDLDSQIAAGEKKLADAEETFKAAVEKLQATYQGLQTTKDDELAAVKASGLGQLKAVKAAIKKGAAATEESSKEEL